jgi:hypothetical protein
MKHTQSSYLVLSLILFVLLKDIIVTWPMKFGMVWAQLSKCISFHLHAAQLLGAKELYSLVAYSLIICDYAYDAKEDIWPADHCQDLLVHYLLISKLYTNIIIRMQ